MARGSRPTKTPNSVFMGAEPRKLDLTAPSEYGRALTWYNVEYDSTEATEKLLVPWLMENNRQDEIPALKAYGYARIPVLLGSIARMLTNGAMLPDSAVPYLNQRLAEIEEEGGLMLARKLLEAKKEEENVVVKQTLKEKSDDRLSNCIAEIDQAIDEICFKGETQFKPYEYFKEHNIKGIHTTAIAQKYKPLIKELQEVIEARDPELKDAYRRAMTMQRVRQFKAWLEQLLMDCGSVVNTARITRKKRTPKEKPASKLVESVKYLKENVGLKAVSIDPVKIIGAKQLWLYDTEYQKLTLINAVDEKGLQVSGTTVKNIDPQTSIAKRVKNPAQAVQLVSTAGKVQLRKVLEMIRNREYPASGRINEKTLILRVFA